MSTSHSPSPRPGAHRKQVQRSVGAAGTASLLALALLPVLPLGSTASAAVTVGSNISVFPDRDMVVAVGYTEGEQLLVEAVRNGAVIGSTQGPAVETPEGIGLEVNHGPLGTAQPGDCWTGFTPDIVGGDVIRVTPVGRPDAVADTMTVADIAFSGAPVLEADGSVSVSGTATPGTDFAVEFRRDKPDPRFRRGPFVPVFEAGTNTWKATFRPTATSAEGLNADQQRQIALEEASWLAVADDITETTLAELGEPGGVGPGCTGSADPNSLVGGLDPINIASGDVTFSGTARAGVAAVSVTVGALGARDATVTADPAGGPSTWSLTVPKADLSTLPDGGVAITPRFDTLAGATRTVQKDTVAPLAPTPSVAPGTYSSTQSVVLNKPAGETTSKVYWEIGNTAVPDPDEFSNLYTGQIAVTSTQTLKGRLVDAAGNLGAVGTFDYRIGTPPAAPSGLTAVESTTAAGTANLRWSAAAGATGYNVYRDAVKVNATPITGTTLNDRAGIGEHTYLVRAVEANGIESLDSNAVTVDIAAPAVPSGLQALEGDARVTLSWTAVAGASSYRVFRDGVALPSLVSGTSYIDAGRTNGTLYEYAISALDAGGNESARTGIVQAVPQVPADTTPPPAPTVNPATGTYTSAQTVTATNAEAGAVQRYTIGTGTTPPAEPTAADTQVPSAGVPVSASSVVKVASFDAAGNRSTVVTRTYTIDTTPPPASTVSPASGTYTGGQTVTATNTEAGVVHRYTVATGTTVPADPTTTSTLLPAAGLSVSASSVVKIAAFDAAGNRTVSTATYTINTAPPADTTPPPAPSVNPAAGTYTSAQTVTATNTEAGVVHRYTVATGATVPADPTTASTQLPAGGLPVSSSSTVKIASFDAAGNRSTVVSRAYTISTPPPAGTRQVVVNATADTVVSQASPTTAGGALASLGADSQTTTGNAATRQTSYLRFTVPALATGESITAANLSLNVTNATTDGPAIWRTATTWTEGTMTWNTGQPTPSGTAAAGNFGSMAVGQASVPVTGVTANSTQSFQVLADGTDGVDFTSREGAVAPQLVLTVATGGSTTPPADTTPPPAPSVTPATGTYTSTQTVTATNTEAGVTHRYTVGSGSTVPADPTASSAALPATGLAVSASSVVKVAAFDAAGNRSPITQRNYTISTGTTRTVVVTAEADTMVKQASPTAGFGSAVTLLSDGQELTTTGSAVHSFVRYNVTGLAAGETVTAASLSVLTGPTTGGTTNGPAVWRTANTATAAATETATWNTGKPARSGTAPVGNFGAMGHGVREGTAVTGVTGNGVVTFELAPEVTDGLAFSSDETATANKPQLVLTVRSG